MAFRQRAPAASVAYRLLAEGFLLPRIDLPPGMLVDALAEALLITRGPVLATRVDILRSAARGAAIESLRAEHRRLFVGPGRLPAPPFESSYCGDGRMMSPAAADVAKLLNTVERHVSLDRTLLPDHLVVELSLAADLMERGKSESTHLQRLLEDHLARWLPSFVRRLEGASAHPFYVELARLADRLVGLDLARGIS